MVSSLFLQVSDGVDSDITRLSVRLTNGTPDGSIPPENVPETGAAPVLNLLRNEPKQQSTAIYYEGQDKQRWDKLGYNRSEIRELNFGDDDDANSSLAIVYHVQTFKLDHYNDFFNNPAVLEIPRTVAGMANVTQAQIDGIPASHAWTPGDVPYLGWNTITASPVYRTHKFYLPYGELSIKRTNDHSHLQHHDEEGVIHWFYEPQGTDDWRNPQHQQYQENRTMDLDEGEWGVDVVFLQVYDDEGNRSQVRPLMAPIQGLEGRVETRTSFTQTSFENWEDPFHTKHGYGDAPSSASTPQAASPVYSADAWFDDFQDGPAATSFDIVI